MERIIPEAIGATHVVAPVTAPGQHLVQNYNRMDVRFVRGEGCWLIDDRGQRYLDGLAGIAVNLLGHGHAGLTAAIAVQAGTLIHTSNIFHVGPQELLADKLCLHAGLDRVFFCNSGTEANECAFKVSRLWNNNVHGGKKPRLIAAINSFHGRTMAALSLTGNEHYHHGFEPLFPVEFVPYGDLAALQKLMADDVSAVFLEPLQGEGGIRVPDPAYLPGVRALCDTHQALLCLDEVQTGVGRLGSMYGFQSNGGPAFKPDTISLAKGLAGGVPIGATIMTEKLAALLVPGTHASTFGGNHLACAAGLYVVGEVEKPGFMDNVRARGEQLKAGLAHLFPGKEVRGRGLLVGVDLGVAPRPLQLACLAQGLVIGGAGSSVLRLAPPLLINSYECDSLLRRLAAALATLPGAKA